MPAKIATCYIQDYTVKEITNASRPNDDDPSNIYLRLCRRIKILGVKLKILKPGE
jgi:hypothetical protein